MANSCGNQALTREFEKFGFTVDKSGTLSATQANQLYGVNSSLRSLRLDNQVSDRTTFIDYLILTDLIPHSALLNI